MTGADLRAAAGELRELAEQLDAVDALCVGGVERLAGLTVVPVAVHDALCGWRVASPRESTPPVLACAGCGLGYLVDDVRRRVDR